MSVFEVVVPPVIKRYETGASSEGRCSKLLLEFRLTQWAEMPREKRQMHVKRSGRNDNARV